MLRFAGVQDSAAANENIAGALGWCAFDYNSNHFTADHSINYHGVADIFRVPKHAGYFFRSQAAPVAAGGGPMVYIAHYWKKALVPNDVLVASNCEEVELFVNGRSLGRKKPSLYQSLPYPLYSWTSVVYRPGELKAIGYIKGAVAATFIRKTPGAPVALRMVPDDTILFDGGDMTRVVVVAMDRYGQTVPGAVNSVSVFTDGPADFFGESPIALEDGKTAFFVKTRSDEDGVAKFRAQSRGLTADSVKITIRSDPGSILRKKILGR
jgi:beta-galactosidase